MRTIRHIRSFECGSRPCRKTGGPCPRWCALIFIGTFQGSCALGGTREFVHVDVTYYCLFAPYPWECHASVLDLLQCALPWKPGVSQNLWAMSTRVFFFHRHLPQGALRFVELVNFVLVDMTYGPSAAPLGSAALCVVGESRGRAILVSARLRVGGSPVCRKNGWALPTLVCCFCLFGTSPSKLYCASRNL